EDAGGRKHAGRVAMRNAIALSCCRSSAGPWDMSRSVRQTAPAVVLLLILAAPASFRAQSSPSHTLTFAELSYGNTISGLARDASGGVWFAGQTCSATLPTTAGAFQRSAPASTCNGMFGRMTADGAVTYLSYLGGSRESRANAIAIDSAGNVYIAGYTF